ncbi:MAG: NAD(+)/NADH kinase, partial [Solirubrobacteraceae bacterium]
MTVLTHRRPAQTASALQTLISQAAAGGVTLRLDPDETRKHKPSASEHVVLDAPIKDDVELCVVLGGDGTILRALQLYSGSGVPVFAVNFGEIGFLATIDPDELLEGIERAISGDFELLKLPAILLQTPTGLERAINDVAIHRKVGERVAELAYARDGQEVGSVRCDGLVVATPAGSTGYNLANGGPVMAWGVEGFVVSFIAPHSLTARTLVVAPTDPLTVHNRS